MPGIIEANRSFAAALYCALAQENRDSFIFAPLPFSSAFALLLNGADTETQKEILAVTRLGGLTLEEINQQNLRLQRTLEELASANQSFLLANSLWASLPLEFTPAFLKAGHDWYQTEAISAVRRELPERISKWSLEKTRGKVDMRLPETDFALLSTTYFKGAWERPFDESKTTQQEFHPETGPVHRVSMMAQHGQYDYLEEDSFHAVALRFSGATMHFVLPRKTFLRRNSIYEIEKEVLEEGWIFTQRFVNRPGLVKIPRFSISYDGNFLPLLEKLGIQRLFTSFDALRPAVTHPDGAKVTDVQQNSFIAVDEKGAEAASTLAMAMMAGSARGWKPPKPFEFVADRPFCFWITENQTGSILFMGRIADIH